MRIKETPANFNSHAHVERDENLKSCYAYSIISTHTLTWSVTGVPQTWGGDYHNFNSHAHVERDGNAEKIKLFEKNFNSHAHVERDP